MQLLYVSTMLYCFCSFVLSDKPDGTSFLHLIHVSIWQKAHRKYLEGDWTNLLYVTFKADKSGSLLPGSNRSRLPVGGRVCYKTNVTAVWSGRFLKMPSTSHKTATTAVSMLAAIAAAKHASPFLHFCFTEYQDQLKAFQTGAWQDG